MMLRDRIRSAFLIATSLSALLAVQPAAAATVTQTSGTVGSYAFQDDHDTTRGADCVYEDHNETHDGATGHWLDKLSIRGPKIHAYDNGSGTKQWVGWKYKVQTQPTGTPNAPWHDLYGSSVSKQLVSIAGGYQFPRRTWTAPASFSDVNIRVVVVLTWYKRNAPPTGANVVRHTTELVWAFRKSPGLKWDAYKSTMFDVPMPTIS